MKHFTRVLIDLVSLAMIAGGISVDSVPITLVGLAGIVYVLAVPFFVRKPKVNLCTRQEPHICGVNGPCNGEPRYIWTAIDHAYGPDHSVVVDQALMDRVRYLDETDPAVTGLR
jgi:hypothetical protein